MKRIALIRNANSFDFGGAELFPINQARELTKFGYAPVILSAHKKTLSSAKKDGFKVKKSPWLSSQNFSGIRILLFPVYLVWILILTVWYFIFFLKNHIDIAHPQSRDDFVAATLAAKLLHRKIIWSDHADLKYVYMNHKSWYKNPVGKLVYITSLFANHVTIESNSEKKLIEESLGKNLPSNYSVVPIGVVDSYKPVKQKNKKLVLVSASRLVVAKGIGELIEAFKLIDSSNVILRLCGDGPDGNHFKSIASDIKNIEFLGYVDDIIQALQSSDVYIHPSYHESFGLSLVEAEMCGLPIIASNVDSIPEIVQDGTSGILVPVKDVKALAKAMETLIKNPQKREKMGQAGRQIYLKNFQFDKIVKEKFIPLYEQA